MMNFDKLNNLSIEELESLSYYEIVSKIGLTSFNWNGIKPIELIVKEAPITKESVVLMVGCGAGGTSIHFAEITGANFHGIDLSPASVEEAKNGALLSPAKDLLHFQVADAHQIPYPDATFDVAITEFMAFFLKPQAFSEIYRVLKPKGKLYLSEIMKDPAVNPKANLKILDMEKLYSEVTGFPFHIPLTTDYTKILTEAGFRDVKLLKIFERPKTSELIKTVGGVKNLFKISKVIIKIMLKSHKIGELFMKQGKVKQTMIKNKKTAKFILPTVMQGLKSV